MDLVHVVVLVPLGEELLGRIAAVRSNIRVHDVPTMFSLAGKRFVEKPDGPSREQLESLLAQAEILSGT